MPSPIRQVGAIPYRIGSLGLEVLLITTSRLGWAIPKGHLDHGVKRRAMAEIETLEEAGAIGRVRGPALGSFTYLKSGRFPARVKVYPLCVAEVLDRWDEDDRRERRWLPVEEAARLVAHPKLARLIRRLARRHAS